MDNEVDIEILVHEPRLELSLKAGPLAEITDWALASCSDAFDQSGGDFMGINPPRNELSLVQVQFETIEDFDQWFIAMLPTHRVTFESIENLDPDFVDWCFASGIHISALVHGYRMFMGQWESLCTMIHDYWTDSHYCAGIEEMKQ